MVMFTGPLGIFSILWLLESQEEITNSAIIVAMDSKAERILNFFIARIDNGNFVRIFTRNYKIQLWFFGRDGPHPPFVVEFGKVGIWDRNETVGTWTK